MAGHHCNVVFGNYHGLFPESSRAQIHSVRSMSSLLSAYPIPDADFSFFYFLSIPALPSFDLHSTRPQNVRKAAEDEHEERIRQEEEDEEDKKHTEVERVISVVSHA